MMTPPTGYNEVIDRSSRRREKSRDAARCRRQQESDTYNEICEVIPICSKALSQMDRSTVMRLMISFMKLRKVLNRVSFNGQSVKEEMPCEFPDDEEYVNALNGFIIVLSYDYDILYTSANVKQYIGITSLELIGQNLFGYTHEGDHGEITKCMNTNTYQEEHNHSFFMRMKSTLTSSGKNVNLKSATYKVLKCDGIVHHPKDRTKSCMVAYCEPIPHPSNIEMVLDSKTFLSQHSLDMKFTFCDSQRVCNLLGYTERDMMGKSYYDFCHTVDLKHLESSMQKLFRLGQVTTDRYRMLAKCGGYVYSVSQVTIINNPRNQQPSYIVCIHYIISDILEPNLILSTAQKDFASMSIPTVIENQIIDEAMVDEQCAPQDRTNTIFSDSTDSIFCDTEMVDSVANYTGEGVESSFKAPSSKSMESMAQNAPSIGDQIDFSQLNFSEMFDMDSVEDLCNNAPSLEEQWKKISPIHEEKIGDVFADVTINEDCRYPDGYNQCGITPQAQQMLREHRSVIPNQIQMQSQRCQSSSPPYLNGNSPPPLVSRYPVYQASPEPLVHRTLPKGGYHLVDVPRAQYQRHVHHQPTKRRHEPRELYCDESYGRKVAFDLPEVPIKKTKYPALSEADRLLCQRFRGNQNVPDAAKLLLNGKQAIGGNQTLKEILLTPSNTCENFPYNNRSAVVDTRKSCKDSDSSRLPDGNGNMLPVLSLHDCEVNAPVNDNKLSTMDWMNLSSSLCF